MPIFREIIASELETCQLQHRNFKLSFPSKNIKRLLADITNTDKGGVQQQSSKSCQSKITTSNQNRQVTDV